MKNKQESGYVYILTNPSFREDWVKIGKSSRPVDIRSKELDNTAVPLPFEIFATIETVKYNEVEKQVHSMIDDLTDFRIRPNREFFNISPQKALNFLRHIALTIDDADIKVYANTGNVECNEGSTQKTITTHKGKRELFTINGDGAFYKNGCALEIIRRYVKDKNPTFKDIKLVLDEKTPHLVMSVDEINRRNNNSSDKSKNSRWHYKSPLKSFDGIEFLVSTQVGDNCPIDFKDIVSLAETLGYKIRRKD